VAYSLKIAPPVTTFLRNFTGLSRQGRVRLFANLDSDLREQGDIYRQDPARSLAPGSPYFWYRIIFMDTDRDGRVWQFSFVVNDSAAVFGVLQVEYVEASGGSR
jgi:hypothetical protein